MVTKLANKMAAMGARSVIEPVFRRVASNHCSKTMNSMFSAAVESHRGSVMPVAAPGASGRLSSEIPHDGDTAPGACWVPNGRSVGSQCHIQAVDHACRSRTNGWIVLGLSRPICGKSRWRGRKAMFSLQREVRIDINGDCPVAKLQSDRGVVAAPPNTSKTRELSSHDDTIIRRTSSGGKVAVWAPW
jgi:hypothetical protein